MILYQAANSRGINHNDIRIYEDFSYVPHFHRDFELIYVEKGDLDVIVDGRPYRTVEDQMALILSNQIHSYESTAPNRVFVHVFSSDNVPAFAKLIADREACTPVFDCDQAARDFYLSCIMGQKRSALSLKAALYAVCSDFWEKSEFVPTRGGNTRLLHQMLSYISEHYCEEITLEKMAQALGYEPHYLSRVFSGGIKINLRAYINLYRTDSARERLVDGEDSIARIALESGFQSIRNFNQVFAASMGMTPMEYQKHFQKEEQEGTSNENGRQNAGRRKVIAEWKNI